MQNDNHSFYVSFLDYESETVKHFCSITYRVQVFMPCPEVDLKMELNRRQMFSSDFTNKEVTLLLYNIIFGLAEMQKLGLNHGRFGPEFVAKTGHGYAIVEDPTMEPYTFLKELEGKKIFT